MIEYFAMDASHMTEIMNREENVQDLKYSGSLKSDNKEEITWNKEDEVYDFLFYKNIEGIPVAWAGAKSNNVNYSNPCYVRVVVGRDDIKLIADNYTYNIHVAAVRKIINYVHWRMLLLLLIQIINMQAV